MDHQTSESLEGTWDTDGWADFDEYPFSGMDVDLKFACLVDRRVEEGKETLRLVSLCCDVETQFCKPGELYPVGHR